MASATKTARRARKGLDADRTDELRIPGGNVAKVRVVKDEKQRTYVTAALHHPETGELARLSFAVEPAALNAAGYQVYETVNRTVLADLLTAVRNWVNDVG